MSNSYSAFAAYCTEQGISFKAKEPLRCHTTFKIGGECELLACPNSLEQIAGLLQKCQELELPCFILGKGSNVLASDEGFDGVIVKLTEAYSEVAVNGDLLECEAGASLSKVCYTAYENGLTGLEFAWGIPGTIGGALFMNAGAYGGEMKDITVSADYLTKEGLPGTYAKEELELSYRHSIFSDRPGCCITKVVVQLQPGEKEAIKARMDDLMERRKSKQPLEYPSAGSTFKRPEGNYASALIEQCGLKGARIGGAQVSQKHSGFLINAGDATCRDVEELIRLVQTTVEQKTGYHLECEIRRI